MFYGTKLIITQNTVFGSSPAVRCSKPTRNLHTRLMLMRTSGKMDAMEQFDTGLCDRIVGEWPSCLEVAREFDLNVSCLKMS